MSRMNAAQIRHLRKQLGLTPTEFAVRAGVSASTVCLWESGKRHPGGSAQIVLAQLEEEVAQKNGRKQLAAAK